MTDLLLQLEGIEQAALDTLAAAEQTGEGVRLPFPVVNAWWINGSRNFKPLGNVQYFGGWATDAERAGEMVEAGDLVALPKDWFAFEGQSEQGEYQCIGSRAVTFSPIVYRLSWLTQDGKSRRAKYDEAHRRSHLQYLGQVRDSAGLIFPAVLTAKGMQSSNLLTALKEWGKAIAPYRKDLNATRFPLGAFWLAFGTQGDAPDFQSVGSEAKSTITPVKSILPATLTAETVAKRFVGPQVLGQNAEMLNQAADWLAAWKEQAETPANAETFDEFAPA